MDYRTHFNNELSNMHLDLLKMVSYVESAIEKSIEALVKKDREMAKSVIADDDIIDNMNVVLENECVRLIATQQPIARDLRKLFTVIKLMTDLERIADYAVDISKHTLYLVEEEYIKPLIDIPKIGKLVKKMVRDSITAYINNDVELAKNTCLIDKEVDTLNKGMYSELTDLMMKDYKNVKQGTHFLFISSYLERVADHTTNICEWVIFIETGVHEDLNY